MAAAISGFLLADLHASMHGRMCIPTQHDRQTEGLDSYSNQQPDHPSRHRYIFTYTGGIG